MRLVTVLNDYYCKDKSIWKITGNRPVRLHRKQELQIILNPGLNAAINSFTWHATNFF
jgi:hypothetical protein